MNPLISIVTLNWNRKEDVQQTLAAIQLQAYEPKEVIVVDNGSTDGSVEAIRQNFPGVKVLALPENLGVQGYNEGMKKATGEIILLIDNDMDLLQTDTLEKIRDYFSSQPALGSVALQVRDSGKKNLSHNNPKYWAEKGDDVRGFPCSTFDGGGVAFRKDVLLKVGYYLPEFFVYHSEVDLSTRIWDAGFEIRYFPAVAVSHRESQIARSSDLQTSYSVRNYLWYVWLYYPWSMAIPETFHFLQRSFLQNIRRKSSMKAWMKGLWSGIAGWPMIASKRRPAKKETIAWMQLLRDKDRERKMDLEAGRPD